MFEWTKTITREEHGQLLRDILRSKLGISQRMLNDLKFRGEISLNQTPVTVRVRVKAGDVLRLALAEPGKSRVEPESTTLEIVYEGPDVLIVNKPAGVLIHPLPHEQRGTLANAIAGYYRDSGADRPVRIVTRLDRATSGLVLVAKHALAQHHYGATADRLRRYYLALVEGSMDTAYGVIKAPIAVNPSNPVTRVVDERSGKPAATEYRVLRVLGTASLLELRLLTGRTHQIRVHLSHIGHPLLGDAQYGGSTELIQRQALHCHRLHLIDLRTQEEMIVSSPLPPDIADAAATLTGTSLS
ncbi:MAG: RluA family pseudouridine synthase [Bacillota bacterium]